MKIYEASYCPCCFESTPYALSLHRTREGAQKALDEHRAMVINEYEHVVTEEHPIEEWIEDQYWEIREHELKH